MSKRNNNSFRPTLTLLENRDMPNVSAVSLSGGILTVKANSATTNVLVSQPASGAVAVKDDLADKTWSYPGSEIKEVIVEAGSGTDTFTATTTHPFTSKLVVFEGGSGTDDFVGESGPVSMIAGSGNDTLSAPSGDDTLLGGTGSDYMIGGTGNDYLQAGSGNDYLNGGTGVATIVAGIGNDTIVAMNGQASDTVFTGIGNAVIWSDSINGVTDNIIGSTNNTTIQAVSGFENPGATTILNGGTFQEPTLLPGQTYEAFTKRPLFASNGATPQDVMQYINAANAAKKLGAEGTGTTLDDSWLLAGLAAIATEDPQALENNVVDFGDGTYGVDLGGFYYRVDDELPVNAYGETYSAYASVGLQNSMWVPIVEKAFAYYASFINSPSYYSLNAANGGVTPEVYAAFGATAAGTTALNGPSGFANSTQLGNFIGDLVSNGYSTCVGLTTAIATGTSITTGKVVTLPADREYTVLSFTINISSGLVNGVILRDPDGTNTDGVLVTIAALFGSTGTVDYGNP